MSICYLAIDVGGVKLAAAVVSEQGEVLVRDRIATPQREVWPALSRLVLRVIGQRPDATAGEIARMLDLHASTLTGVLARLEERGMLARHVDPGDRRRARFTLTAAGRRADREQKGTVEAAVRRALAKVPDRTATQVRALLATLVVELERPE